MPKLTDLEQGLFDAVSSNKIEDVEKYFAQNPDVNINAVNQYGNTVLHIAANNQNDEIISLLLNKGADKTIKDAKGYKAVDIRGNEAGRFKGMNPVDAKMFSLAIKATAPELEKFFKEYGIGDVNGGNANWIAKPKYNINAKDAYGNTALHIATLRGDIEMARLLIEKGADLDIADSKKYTVEILARLSGNGFKWQQFALDRQGQAMSKL